MLSAITVAAMLGTGVAVVIRGQPWGNLYLTEKDGGPFDEADEARASLPVGPTEASLKRPAIIPTAAAASAAPR